MDTLVVCPNCEKVSRVKLDRAEQAKPICGNCKAELPYHHGVQSVSGGGLARLLRASNRPVVVDFWAEWCGPCKMFAPTFQAAAQEMGGKIIFAKLDTEAHQLAAQTYGIRGIPTLLVFKNGVEVARQSGAMPLPTFLGFLKSHLS